MREPVNKQVFDMTTISYSQLHAAQALHDFHYLAVAGIAPLCPDLGDFDTQNHAAHTTGYSRRNRQQERYIQSLDMTRLAEHLFWHIFDQQQIMYNKGEAVLPVLLDHKQEARQRGVCDKTMTRAIEQLLDLKIVRRRKIPQSNHYEYVAVLPGELRSGYPEDKLPIQDKTVPCPMDNNVPPNKEVINTNLQKNFSAKASNAPKRSRPSCDRSPVFFGKGISDSVQNRLPGYRIDPADPDSHVTADKPRFRQHLRWIIPKLRAAGRVTAKEQAEILSMFEFQASQNLRDAVHNFGIYYKLLLAGEYDRPYGFDAWLKTSQLH